LQGLHDLPVLLLQLLFFLCSRFHGSSVMLLQRQVRCVAGSKVGLQLRHLLLQLCCLRALLRDAPDAHSQ
jgi:hypothetical protein